MLLLIGSLEYAFYVQQDFVLSNGEVCMFFVALHRPKIFFLIRRMISTTEDTLDITIFFFLVEFVCQVVTWEFTSSGVAIIFGVSTYLTV
jgi:hypothetical protein